MLLTIIVFIIILSLLIFVHELGHFVSARKSGMAVEEFGFGLPPRIFGFKKGGTIYSINWIPLGGFVKIKGEDGGGKDDSDSFANKKIWQRAVVLSSGVLMNFLLAFVLFSFGFSIGLPQVINSHYDEARAKDVKIQIVSVVKNSPAQKAEMEAGDIVLEVDGQKFKEIEEIQNYIAGQDDVVFVKVKRGGEELTKEIVPEILKLEPGDLAEGETLPQKRLMGVGLVKTGIISYPLHQAVWNGAKTTVSLTGKILVAFYDLFRDMIVKREVSADVSGPVGIAVATGRVVNLGFIYVIQFAAVLSLNLGIINLLPLPALDGGRLLFLAIEKIRRKPVDQRIEAIIHNIGFTLLMILAILVTFRDIGKFGGKFLEAIKNILPF